MRWQHRQMRSDRQLPAFVAADYRRLLRARSRNFSSRAAKGPLQNRGFSSIFVSLWHLSDLAGRADDVCCWGQSRPRNYERRLPKMTRMYGPAAFRKRDCAWIAEVADLHPDLLIGSRAVALVGIRTHLWSH